VQPTHREGNLVIADLDSVGRQLGVTVLVMDDDSAVLRDVCALLATFRMAAVTSKSTVEAVRIVGLAKIDVALIDWRPGGQDDGIALGQSLRRNQGIPFVVFSGFLNTEVTGNAYKQGAADVIDKPVRPSRLLAALRLALGHRASATSRAVQLRSTHRGAHSISERWARVALRACSADKDPSTEAAVADAAGVSTSVYRRDCSECGADAFAARDLIRLLRANSLAQQDGSTLRSHLCTSDPRTAKRLFERAGLPMDSKFIPLRQFFLLQSLVPSASECLRALAHLAANDHLFFVEPDDEKTGTDES
jgi:FixJ family two-component response regulator